MLLEVNRTLVSSLEVYNLFPAISDSLRKVLKYDVARLAIYDEATKSMRLHALDPLPGVLAPILVAPLDEAACGVAVPGTGTKVGNCHAISEDQSAYIKRM